MTGTSLRVLASFALVGALLGCGNIVTTNGNDPMNGTGGSNTTYAVSVGNGGSTSSYVDPAPGPNDIAEWKNGALVVSLTDYTPTCGDNQSVPCAASVHDKITMRLPENSQTGQVFQLSDIGGSVQGTNPDNQGPGAACEPAGGVFNQGTVEILSMSDSDIHLRLTGTGGFTLWFNGPTDGDYDVAICPAAAPVSQVFDTAVVQVTPPTQEGDYGSYTITLSNSAESFDDACQAPVEHVTFYSVPAQASGSAFPGLGTLERWGPSSTAPQCFVGSDNYTGEVQILSIDPTTVTFRVSDTANLGTPNGNADGVYTATVVF